MLRVTIVSQSVSERVSEAPYRDATLYKLESIQIEYFISVYRTNRADMAVRTVLQI